MDRLLLIVPGASDAELAKGRAAAWAAVHAAGYTFSQLYAGWYVYSRWRALRPPSETESVADTLDIVAYVIARVAAIEGALGGRAEPLGCELAVLPAEL